MAPRENAAAIAGTLSRYFSMSDSQITSLSHRGIFLAPLVGVIVLVGAISWRIFSTPQTAAVTKADTVAASAVAANDFSVSPDTQFDPLSGTSSVGTSSLTDLGTSIVQSMANAYVDLAQKGTIDDDALAETGRSLAKTITPQVETKVYTADDLDLTIDTSAARALKYRSDLRDALRPLLEIPRPEFAAYGAYVQTKDPSVLLELNADASRYTTAAKNTLAVTAPSDAQAHQLAIINAMQAFGDTLRALTLHANDPFASGALLKSYNSAEENVATSFQDLAQYFRNKVGATSTSVL